MLRVIADQIPSFIWIADSDMNFYFINKAWLNFTHSPKKNLLGKKWINLVSPDDKNEIKSKITKVVNKPGFFSVQFRLYHHSGNYKWVVLKGKATTDRYTGKLNFVGSGSEISGSFGGEQNKTDFMNFASHEIKTPLTALQIYLDIMEKRIKDKNISDLPRFIKKVKTNTNTLTELTNSFLDITRTQTGKMILVKKSANIADLVKSIYEETKMVYKKHNIVLQKTTSVQTKVDINRLKQVIVNLISNAARYSDNGSTITLSQTVEDGFVVIKVKDEGIGIPKSEHKKIFQKYYQLKRNPYKVIGMGMGLYIANAIIRSHGGKISVESKIGKGSTFIIKLPLDNQANKHER